MTLVGEAEDVSMTKRFCVTHLCYATGRDHD